MLGVYRPEFWQTPRSAPSASRDNQEFKKDYTGQDAQVLKTRREIAFHATIEAG